MLDWKRSYFCVLSSETLFKCNLQASTDDFLCKAVVQSIHNFLLLLMGLVFTGSTIVTTMEVLSLWLAIMAIRPQS